MLSLKSANVLLWAKRLSQAPVWKWFKLVSRNRFFRPVSGAVLGALLGLFLWKTPPGEPWVHASYDYLFRFGTRTVTNDVVLILMDNESFDEFGQERGVPWDRALHAHLLERLADDGCSLVVWDSHFKERRDPVKDAALAQALRRQRKVVLMAEHAGSTYNAQLAQPYLDAASPTLPNELFLQAPNTTWGVAWLDPDLDSIVRRHWPFPAPGPYASLPTAAARAAGAQLSDESQERWLRYYGRDGCWPRLGYHFWSSRPTNYFRDKIVFIGTQPRTSVPSGERDEFSTPYTRFYGESVGGVEIMVTAFLNLMNGDWLRRASPTVEALVIVIAGILLGGTWGRLRPVAACVSAAGVAAGVTIAAVMLSDRTNYWFPWLVIVAGQLPFALVWALLMPTIRRVQETITIARTSRAAERAGRSRAEPAVASVTLETADYELLDPPFGEGAYGKVWLAKNAIEQWQALKVVYLANFENNPEPYEREFSGISKYKPVSDKHPGLLRVDFVSRKKAGYFYYVMELGDALEPGWEREPSKYKPRDLASERSRAPGRRLPVRECIRLGIQLADALDFLHRQGLTHRDIKPQNIIFVNGQPKLADVGLTAAIRPGDKERTFVGTPGYMPPPPERPGTPQADIYSLGMVLYVTSTGRNAAYFPEIATTLVDSPTPADFFPLNNVILKACHPDPAQRYATAAEMQSALLEAQKGLGEEATAETTKK